MASNHVLQCLALAALLLAPCPQVYSIPLFGGKQPASSFSHTQFHQDAAPSKIKFRDLNFIQLTDVHSWLSGHAHEPKDEAGYPDVLAFVQHLQNKAEAEGKDLFLFNSGDIVDGTGLSDATKVRGVLITPIIQQMPFAALTSGNHELYHDSTITNIAQSGFVEHWNGHYLTANIHNATTGKLIGNPYTLITGKMGTKLLVMGFLYNMQNSCEAVTVTPVQKALQEPWFDEAMEDADGVDAIVVLVHMDAKDPLIQSIISAIRAKDATSSIVFLAGHTHIRDFHTFDERCVSMESGKYLDTVGFISCDLPSSATDGMMCDHTFVTPHVPTFMEYTKTTADTFDTPESKKMRGDIAVLRSKLGLDEVIGCSPETYLPFAPLDDPKSMWSLYIYHVLPTVLYPDAKEAVFVAGTGALRYQIFQGQVHLDDTYVVSPFKDIYMVAHLKGSVVAPLVKLLLNTQQNPLTARSSDKQLTEWEFPWVSSVAPENIKADVLYELIYVEFDGETVAEKFEKVTGGELVSEPYKSADFDSRNVWEMYVRKQWPCKEVPPV
mmetsp:Transcript_20753/g.42200  ORF Transcript_20753/g.42200 Transcript_20753/m.42200 type:complete len:551 (-) Transcript_20753:138-1790(-)